MNNKLFDNYLSSTKHVITFIPENTTVPAFISVTLINSTVKYICSAVSVLSYTWSLFLFYIFTKLIKLYIATWLTTVETCHSNVFIPESF